MNLFLQPQVVLGGVFLFYAMIGLFALWSSKMQKKGGINRLLPTVVVGKVGIFLFCSSYLMLPVYMGVIIYATYPAKDLALIDNTFAASASASFIVGFVFIVVAKGMAASVLRSLKENDGALLENRGTKSLVERVVPPDIGMGGKHDVQPRRKSELLEETTSY